MLILRARRSRLIRNVLVGLLVILVGGASCFRQAKAGQLASIGNFVFPNTSNGPRLRLVSLFTNPKAQDFVQSESSQNNYFAGPSQVAFGPAGEYYLLDGARGRYTRVRIDNDIIKSYKDFPNGSRSFPSATAITVDDAGRIWLVDSQLKLVFIFSESGELVDSVQGEFYRPVGIVYHPGLRKILVSDLALNKIFSIATDDGHEISEIHFDNILETTVESIGESISEVTGDSSEQVSGLDGPSFMAVGVEGNIYVCNALGGTVSVFDKEFQPVISIGGFGDGPGLFSRPKGISVDADGLVYVTDALFDNLQIFNPAGELLLTLGHTGSSPGEFSQPVGVSIDPKGLVFVADFFNRRFQVYQWEL